MTKLIRLMYLTFLLSIVTFAILSFSFIQRLKKQDKYIRNIEHTHLVLLLLGDINAQLYINGTTLRNMIILNNKKLWPDIVIQNGMILKNVDSLFRLSQNSSQQEKITQMKTLLESRFSVIQDSISFVYDSRDSEATARALTQLTGMLENYQTLYKSIRESEYQTLKMSLKSRDQFERFTLPLLAVLLSFAGMLIIATFFYMMITLKKRIYFQSELQEKIETLNQANKELENLSRVTSHHIQEPMRKIRNFSSLLYGRLEQVEPEEARSIISKIEGNAASLQALAQNLVQYSHLIQEQRPRERVDLNELVDEAISRLDDLIYENSATVYREKLPVIRAIPGQLFVMFQELIKNSLQFAKAGENPHIEVIRLLPRRNGTVLIAVRDNGLGFSSDYAERIFRIFEQLEPRSSPGKGLGLAMCSRIMLNHGGHIWAEGEPGKGAVFFLEFPV